MPAGPAWVVAGLWLVVLVAGACLPPARTPSPTPTPTPTPTPPVTPPAGASLVDVPEAGIRLPVPDGWESVFAADLADPTVRAELANAYPGAGTLLGALDELGGRARPVFLAADPSPASVGGQLAANVSVLVSQPSVGGILLDFAAGFIEDGLTDVLGAPTEPRRDRVELLAGEAVRFEYDVPAADGERIIALAWVIGAPAGTLLVTLMGTASALGDLEPDAFASAIMPLAVGRP